MKQQSEIFKLLIISFQNGSCNHKLFPCLLSGPGIKTNILSSAEDNGTLFDNNAKYWGIFTGS